MARIRTAFRHAEPSSIVPPHPVITFGDVTAQQRAEQKLCESELRFRSLVENTGAGLLITKSDGIILDCNEAALQMFGYNREELLKTTMHQRYMRDEDRTATVTQFEKDGFFKAHEIEMRRRDGSPIYAKPTNQLYRPAWHRTHIASVKRRSAKSTKEADCRRPPAHCGPPIPRWAPY